MQELRKYIGLGYDSFKCHHTWDLGTLLIPVSIKVSSCRKTSVSLQTDQQVNHSCKGLNGKALLGFEHKTYWAQL